MLTNMTNLFFYDHIFYRKSRIVCGQFGASRLLFGSQQTFGDRKLEAFQVDRIPSDRRRIEGRFRIRQKRVHRSKNGGDGSPGKLHNCH
jgi:hypothetical protein